MRKHTAPTKVCNRCKDEKPVELFIKNYLGNPSPRCKECSAKSINEWREAHKEEIAAKNKEWHQRIRMEAIHAYGDRCDCCGEDDPAFLAIDHVNGGGKLHRKSITSNIYRWLNKNGYPKDGRFRLLCHNCNLAKGFYGSCPHIPFDEMRMVSGC